MNKSICIICGKEVIRRGQRVAKFCSVACKAEWQSRQKPVDKDWLYQKYIIEKLSTYDIAKIVHRNPKRVYEWIADFGIETRKRGENLHGQDNGWAQEGYVNPFAGKKHNENTRRILSQKASKPKPYLMGKNNGMYGRRGQANPHFVDGSSPERQRIYASSEWRSIIRQVYQRDGYRCVRCGATKKGYRSIQAHHIKPWAGNPEMRFDLSNIVTLCHDCHNWVHSNANVDREFIG
ncbi:MAG: HNH endonuclease [Anaerolineaceae bacterium]